MSSVGILCLENNKENACDNKIQKDKDNPQSKRQSEDIQTSDEKSRVLLIIQDKKTKQEAEQKQSQNQQKDKQIQAKLFTKLPSYFLQVQQQSVIYQQPQQSPTQQVISTRPRNRTYQCYNNKQKIRKPSYNSQQQNKIKANQLIYSGLIHTHISHNNWKQSNSYIWDQYLCMGEQKMLLNQITKIKCILEYQRHKQKQMIIKIVKNHSHPFFIKISQSNNHTINNNNNKQIIENQHYLWFSKIIFNKLYLMKNLLKNTKQQYFPKQNKQIQLPQLNIQILCKGIIYKRSQHLNNWQKRYIIITQNQLLSYKNESKDATFIIKSQNIKYIWTRFQLYNGYLIVKIKHNMHKTQFAIPLMNYSQNKGQNWLYCLYKLMGNGKKMGNI